MLLRRSNVTKHVYLQHQVLEFVPTSQFNAFMNSTIRSTSWVHGRPSSWQKDDAWEANLRPREISGKEWDAYKDRIKELYLQDGIMLKDVRRLIYQMHGFYATETQYKKRILCVWNFQKNIPKHKMMAMLQIQDRRQAEDNKPTMFSWHGKPVPGQKVDRSRKRFGNPAPSVACSTPSSVAYWTPRLLTPDINWSPPSPGSNENAKPAAFDSSLPRSASVPAYAASSSMSSPFFRGMDIAEQNELVAPPMQADYSFSSDMAGPDPEYHPSQHLYHTPIPEEPAEHHDPDIFTKESLAAYQPPYKAEAIEAISAYEPPYKASSGRSPELLRFLADRLEQSGDQFLNTKQHADSVAHYEMALRKREMAGTQGDKRIRVILLKLAAMNLELGNMPEASRWLEMVGELTMPVQ
ncbi:hypothetical protein FN846DRAFT_960076 [Sphaerosporella brunnea]|uniref:Clr5 domain-containing protein n=1 Tax=Sphaerosporella brunnea TaxID=1250544 RepID=A0A5J5EQN9_9PEZI|nr:hypothetical protein FN846DRAFT_960061 [Sphaerosporella brunnea]KAA8899719.1 hypothetical protein FN846DRAFT_960076 [Sphaerosporella brunnea]